MKEKDYVRTKNKQFQPSQIAKIEKIEKDMVYKGQKCLNLDHNLLSNYEFLIYEEDVIKSSSNIIELLEPMDLLYIDISPDDCGGIVVPRIPETLDELKKYIEKIKSGEYILKYVVTHEQLENNMYKVGE